MVGECLWVDQSLSMRMSLRVLQNPMKGSGLHVRILPRPEAPERTDPHPVPCSALAVPRISASNSIDESLTGPEDGGALKSTHAQA